MEETFQQPQSQNLQLANNFLFEPKTKIVKPQTLRLKVLQELLTSHTNCTAPLLVYKKYTPTTRL